MLTPRYRKVASVFFLYYTIFCGNANFWNFSFQLTDKRSDTYWVKYFERKDSIWSLRDVEFVLNPTEVVRPLASPDIELRGRAFRYIFRELL